jgi:hypothetical protein
MADEKNYTVEGNIVYADIAKLTDEEVKEIKRFQDFGFEVKYEVYHKATVKKHKEENDRNNGVKKVESLKEKDILNYLEDNDPEAKTTYQEKKDEKGFNSAKYWFMSKYPVAVAGVQAAIEEKDGSLNKFEEAFDKYTKSIKAQNRKNEKENKELKVALSEEEYMKVYYWQNRLDEK